MSPRACAWTTATPCPTPCSPSPRSTPGPSRSAGGWTTPGSTSRTPTFTAEVVDVARGLIASGIEPGDRIALLSRTRYEWTLFDYAIVVAGAVTVPIYETSSADQVAWILADSGAKAVIVEDDRHAATVTGRPDAPEHIWRIAPDGDWPGAVRC